MAERLSATASGTNFSITTSTTYATVPNSTATLSSPAASKRYVILGQGHFSQTAAGGPFQVKARLYNVTDSLVEGELVAHQAQQATTNDGWVAASFLGLITTGGSPPGSISARLEYATSASGSTMTSKPIVTIVELSDRDGYQEDDSPSSNSSTSTWADASTLSLIVADSTADYYIWAVADVQNATSTAAAELRFLLEDASTARSTAVIDQPSTSDWVRWGSLNKRTLATGTHTFKVQHRAVGSGASAPRNVRILALRVGSEIGDLVAGYIAHDTTRRTSTATTDTERNAASTITPSGSGLTGNCLRLASSFGDSASTSARVRLQATTAFASQQEAFWLPIDTSRRVHVGEMRRITPGSSRHAYSLWGGSAGTFGSDEAAVATVSLEVVAPPATSPDLEYVSAQVTGTGTTLTPSALTVSAGQLVIAHATTRILNQPTAPAGEGWTETGLGGWVTRASPNLGETVFAKVWGLGGQTDDTTPTFSISAGTNGWGMTFSVWSNPDHATAPWTSVADAIAAVATDNDDAASTTMTAPSATDTGSDRTTIRFYSSSDDNAHATPSEGTLGYGGTSYDQTTGDDYAQSMAYLVEDTTSGSTGTATMSQGANGADTYISRTLVLKIPASGTTLVVANAAHAHTADGAALTQHNVLVVANAAHAHSAQSPALTQHGILVVANASHDHTAQAPALTQHNVLLVANAAHGHTADGPTLTQHNVLAPANAAHTVTSDQLALVQHGALTVGGASHAHSAENASLTQHYSITVQGAVHAHTADSTTLEVKYPLTLQDGVHAHTAGSPSLVQHGVLVVADALHGHSAQSPSLTQHNVLVVASATHAVTSDTPSLTQHNVLGVDGGVHGHTADNVSLGVAGTVTPNFASHAHSADNVVLVQHHVLVVDGAVHAHSAETPTLAAKYVLTVASAAHGHTAESLELVSAGALAVQSASHAHSADNVTVLAKYSLVVADALHGHTADAVVLVTHQVLVVANALHLHSATLVIFSLPVAPLTRTFVVPSERRLLVVSREPDAVHVPTESRVMTIT